MKFRAAVWSFLLVVWTAATRHFISPAGAGLGPRIAALAEFAVVSSPDLNALRIERQRLRERITLIAAPETPYLH